MQELIGNVVHNQRVWFGDVGRHRSRSSVRFASIAVTGLTDIVANLYFLDLPHVRNVG